MNWDDLRFFLALARCSTLSAAAAELEVSHSTVARRIDALTASAGTLFTRGPEGFVLTEAGRELRTVAERMEAEAHGAERVLLRGDASLSGPLRVSTADVLAELFMPAIGSFIERYPEVELQLDVDNRPVDLTRRAADVALRATNEPPETLVGRKLTRLTWAAFASPSIYASRGQSSISRDYPWILWSDRCGGTRARTETWFGGVRDGTVVARVNSMMTAKMMIGASLGAAVIPTVLGDAWGFSQIGRVIESMSTDLWLLTHPDLHQTPRVKAFTAHLAGEVSPAQIPKSA